MSEKSESCRTVELVDQNYQPNKRNLKESLKFPEGTTPEDVARRIMRPVQIRTIQRPRATKID